MFYDNMNSLDHDGIRGHPVHHNCVVKFHVMVLMITRDIIRVSDHTVVSAEDRRGRKWGLSLDTHN